MQYFENYNNINLIILSESSYIKKLNDYNEDISKALKGLSNFEFNPPGINSLNNSSYLSIGINSEFIKNSHSYTQDLIDNEKYSNFYKEFDELKKKKKKNDASIQCSICKKNE